MHMDHFSGTEMPWKIMENHRKSRKGFLSKIMEISETLGL